MKKATLMMTFLVPSFLNGEHEEERIVHQILKRHQAQQAQQQEEVQKLPDELVESLIEHSPALIKKYVHYLKHSVATGEVKPKTLFLPSYSVSLPSYSPPYTDRFLL